jgi:hypothetical protein
MGKSPRKRKGFIVSDVDFDYEEIFDTEQDAEDSIDINIEEIERWGCVDRFEVHEEKEDAYHCCEYSICSRKKGK